VHDRVKSLLRAVLPTAIYGPIRARRVRRFISQYSSRIVEHTYAGHRLRVHLEDGLAESWYDRDWNEPAELVKLREGRLRPHARVMELGAHQGIVALILSRIVGPEGKVVVVEAERHNFEVALRNAKANYAANLTIIHAAAGGKAAGQVSFTEGLNGVVAERGRPGSVEVEAVSIDCLARVHGHPDVVFIDVEGYEAHVLAGARETLAWGTTDVFVELHDAESLAAAGSTAQDVIGHLSPDIYEISVALAGNTPPGLDSSQLGSPWREPASGLHLQGKRCFIVARASGPAGAQAN